MPKPHIIVPIVLDERSIYVQILIIKLMMLSCRERKHKKDRKNV